MTETTEATVVETIEAVSVGPPTIAADGSIALPAPPHRVVYGFLPSTEPVSDADRGARLVWNQAPAIVNDVHAQASEIERDPDLSTEGKLKKRAKLVANGLERLAAAEAGLKPAQQAITNLEAQVATAGTSTSGFEAGELRELRDALRGLPRQERGLKIVGAINRGDLKLLAAVVSAEPWVLDISEALHESVRQALVEARMPANSCATLDAIRCSLAAAQQAVHVARSWLNSSAPIEAFEAAGLKVVRRSKMTAAEKAAYVEQHGQAAFLSLPL